MRFWTATQNLLQFMLLPISIIIKTRTRGNYVIATMFFRVLWRAKVCFESGLRQCLMLDIILSENFKNVTRKTHLKFK